MVLRDVCLFEVSHFQMLSSHEYHTLHRCRVKAKDSNGAVPRSSVVQVHEHENLGGEEHLE